MYKYNIYQSVVLLIIFLSACSPTPVAPCPVTPSGNKVYVVGTGWHAELGIPVAQLGKDLAFYQRVFPGARVIMFGYGKKTFMTSPAGSVTEYILGPVPGPAVIHAVGLSVVPTEAYGSQSVATLALSEQGAKALSAYIRADLMHAEGQAPQSIGRSSTPDGLFYLAASRYNLLHTCNTWTADALHAAGLDVSGKGVTYAHDVMQQVATVSNTQCRVLMGSTGEPRP